MAGDGDSLASLIDASLLGRAFERGGNAGPDQDPLCGNCAAPLVGRYCHVCGQRGAVHRSLWHLMGEYYHGQIRLDGKLWRTAPLLLVRPGTLTRRYVLGQRVSFVSPITLFLFSVFLMFFTVTTIDPANSLTERMKLSAKDRAELRVDLDSARQDLAEAERDVKNDDSPAVAAQAVEAAKSAVTMAEQAAQQGENAAGAVTNVTGAGSRWRDWLQQLADSDHLNILDNPGLTARAKASLRDPDLLLYKLKNVASGYSFLLVPMSLPFVWLMFLGRRDVYLFDHVIFVLHSLSFMALFVVLWTLALRFHIGANLLLWPFLVPPVHMFFHLMAAYRLGVASALWRTGFLIVSAFCVLAVYLAVILGVGLLR